MTPYEVGASCLNNDGSYFCQCTATACGNYGTCKNIAGGSSRDISYDFENLKKIENLKISKGGNAECLCDEFYKYHNQTCQYDNKVS